MNNKGFSTILVVLIIVGVAALGTGGYLYYKNSSAKQAEKTEETKTEETKLNEEETIRQFFTFVDQGNVDGAVKMMSSNMAPDETSKNTWKQSLAGFESVKVTKIERSGMSQDLYKVSLDVQLKPDSQLINWNSGQDTRFVSLVKNSQGVWQINEIATGP